MPTATLKSFADFGLDERLCAALADGGIRTPFPIQELTLPLALSGADVIGQARTGTGKTLGFGLPLLHRIDESTRRVQALVIVPTRELCLQVRDDLAVAAARTDIDVVALYGGKAIEAQAEAIRNGAQVVVGTPGRLLDLRRRGQLDLSNVSGLVLDEADEMLDLGFLPDVEQLIEATAAGRQTMLFSATMPSAVVALARRYMHKPTFLRADVEEVRIAPETEQHFFSCHRMDKPAVLARILQTPNRGLCVVFSRTKRMADILADELRQRGIAAAPIHSDLRQDARERALARFRSGKIDVLVATEVAARGLDIDSVTHVVNYDCPDDEKMYLHRIGRTGRAGATGVAITLTLWNELARLDMIKRALDITTPTHEVYSTSPILDELFDLPPRERHPALTPLDADDDDEAPQVTLAPPATAETDEPDDERAEGDGRRRRRRGGRRRGGRSDEAATDDVTADDVTADDPLEDAPPAGVSDVVRGEPADEQGSDGRRRRIRRRSTGALPETVADSAAGGDTEPVAAAEPPAEDVEGGTGATEVDEASAAEADGEAARGPDGARRRVRRRVAGGGSRPVRDGQPPAGTTPRAEQPAAAARAGGERPSEADAREPDARPGRRRRRRGGTRATSPADATPAGQGTAAAPETAPRSGERSRGRDRSEGRSGSGDRAAGPVHTRRTGGGRRSLEGGRGGDRRRGERWGTPERGPRAEIDVAAARGAGRPTLQRRLVVEHLP